MASMAPERARLWIAFVLLLCYTNLTTSSALSNQTAAAPSSHFKGSESSQLSRRLKYSSCPEEYIRRYERLTRGYVNEFARTALHAAREGNTDPDVRSSFRVHFRQYNRRARQRVREMYRAIAEETARTPQQARVHVLCLDVQFECAHEDRHGRQQVVAVAYVDDTESFIILCPIFHLANDIEKVQTIIHELTHVRVISPRGTTEDFPPNPNVDYIHAWDHLTPGQALNNAWAYELFAEDIWTVYGSPGISESTSEDTN